MLEVNIKELRIQLRSLVDRVEAGEEIIITRRGKEVARLVPPTRTPPPFPDLTEFRAGIKLKGEPLSETVLRERHKARY